MHRWHRVDRNFQIDLKTNYDHQISCFIHIHDPTGFGRELSIFCLGFVMMEIVKFIFLNQYYPTIKTFLLYFLKSLNTSALLL